MTVFSSHHQECKINFDHSPSMHFFVDERIERKDFLMMQLALPMVCQPIVTSLLFEMNVNSVDPDDSDVQIPIN